MNSVWLVAIPIAFSIGGAVGIHIEDSRMAYSTTFDKAVIKSDVRQCEKETNKPCHFASHYDTTQNGRVWQVVPKP